ncbi:MAG: DNA polymerase III subunit beta [Dehalococcoidia bacterium]|nr:DNA polymerase III subunit beta [Dehalococcoidia bacterium]
MSYLKALAGSNMVKVIPANGSASGLQANGKGLKVVCGNHQSYVSDGAWLKDKTPFTFCQVRVSPSYAVMPNLGGNELAEALSRVLPFTNTDDARPVLQCVKVVQKDGKLTLIAADGFTLGEISLDFETGEAEALINRDDVKGLIPALRKAKRVKVSFEQKPDNDNGGLLAKSLVIDTELIKYSLPSQEGSYPDYDKVFPSDFIASASFDTKEAVKACQSLLAIWFDDNTKGLFRPLTLTVADNKVTIEAKEDRGLMAISAETSGEAKIAVAGNYLIKALRACGGIAEMKLASSQSPIALTVDGYRCLVMPMRFPESKAVAEAEAVVRETAAKAEAKVETETKVEAKSKRKGKRKAKKPQVEPEEVAEPVETREPVAVA